MNISPQTPRTLCEAIDGMDTDDVDDDDDGESASSTWTVRRNPLDPTLARGEDSFEETGYMAESAATTSLAAFSLTI